MISSERNSVRVAISACCPGHEYSSVLSPEQKALERTSTSFLGLQKDHAEWCLKHSSISVYEDIKYKFYLDFRLTCYRQATVRKMFSHIHSSPFRECSVPVSEREQNYHVLFLDTSNLWLMPEQDTKPQVSKPCKFTGQL